jgi:hypothetical protein
MFHSCMWCIMRHYFGNGTPQWSWFGLTVLFKGGDITRTQLCCCCTCLSLLRIEIKLRIPTFCPKVILVSLQPLHRKLPRLHRSILAPAYQWLCLRYSLTAPSSPQWNLPRLVTLRHFSSQTLLHAPIVPWPIFLFCPRNHDFQKYHSAAGSSGS